MSQIDLRHYTYHHFMGNGNSDSELDLLLYIGEMNMKENLDKVICKEDNPLIDSHHDAIISSFKVSKVEEPAPLPNEKAPRIENSRVKILWSDEGIANYENLLQANLLRLRETWASDSTKSSIAVLISATNSILNRAATATNSFRSLCDNKPAKQKKHPDITAAQKILLLKQKDLTSILSSSFPSPESIQEARDARASARSAYRQTVRGIQQAEYEERDTRLYEIMSNDPSSLFKQIRASKSSKSVKLHSLTVGEK